jgi:hypothetical protein
MKPRQTATMADRLKFAALALLLLRPAPLLAADPAAMEDRPVAVLGGLDKITARVQTFEVKVGQPLKFGSLEVVVRACKKAPPIDTPEAAALLSIHEHKPDEAPTSLFEGWMFASSPALSALEHPVYDVWVVDCKNAAKADSGNSSGNTASRSSASPSNSR